MNELLEFESIRILSAVIMLGIASFYDIWKRDFKGSSGLFSIVIESPSKAALSHMLDHLQLFRMGQSWGGYESLILPVEPLQHRQFIHTPTEGQYLRLFIGLEDVDDLIQDLDNGFKRLNT